MGHYMYCGSCKAGQDEPEASTLRDGMYCTSCGKELYPDKTIEDFVIELSERISTLEAGINMGEWRA